MVIGAPLAIDSEYVANFDLVEERIISIKARDFDEAIKKGEALGVSRVANALYESATIDKNVTAQIFYLKNRSENWSDRQEVNHNLDLAGILSNAHGRIIEARTDEPESLQLSDNYARTDSRDGRAESLDDRAENKTGQTTTDNKQSGGV